jgi:hypothetical protein
MRSRRREIPPGCRAKIALPNFRYFPHVPHGGRLSNAPQICSESQRPFGSSKVRTVAPKARTPPRRASISLSAGQGRLVHDYGAVTAALRGRIDRMQALQAIGLVDAEDQTQASERLSSLGGAAPRTRGGSAPTGDTSSERTKRAKTRVPASCTVAVGLAIP